MSQIFEPFLGNTGVNHASMSLGACGPAGYIQLGPGYIRASSKIEGLKSLHGDISEVACPSRWVVCSGGCGRFGWSGGCDGDGPGSLYEDPSEMKTCCVDRYVRMHSCTYVSLYVRTSVRLANPNTFVHCLGVGVGERRPTGDASAAVENCESSTAAPRA